MRRLVVSVLATIALASCQTGLKSQIVGKWQQIEPKKETMACTVEFTNEYYIAECNSTPEFLEKFGGTGYNLKDVANFELDGDRIIFNASGTKSISKIKIEDGFLLIEDNKDKWRKLTRQK